MFPIDVAEVKRLQASVKQLFLTAFAKDQAVVDGFASIGWSLFQYNIQVINGCADAALRKRHHPAAVLVGLRGQKFAHHIREQHLR
ncbi:hypothetical protein SDC9_120438 [bioreactor metagenome]|uniref:Uncharacterized protein n=1 Tax=bioreactor metagenome TaxID=1076179 RepID=A0A645C7S4_9ZZZZ